CFFQAEGGIRVFHVTGVQTCALPISTTARSPEQIEQIAALALGELAAERAELFAIIVNRAEPDALKEIVDGIGVDRTPVWAIPEIGGAACRGSVESAEVGRRLRATAR